MVLDRQTIKALIQHEISVEDPVLKDLEAGHFVSIGSADVHAELLAAQIRTQKSTLPELTALHIFVVTLRCEHSCKYCQVSRVSQDRTAYDMSKDTADQAIRLALSSPAESIKIEFQGGEPLLNFELIEYVVAEVEVRRGSKAVSYVVATNLACLTDDMLVFFKQHRFAISTSLDGPKDLHNSNRPRLGGDSYERALEGIERCRRVLGHEYVSALLTCSASSLSRPEEIIDEYVALGFREIFLRHISPYGFAVRSVKRIGYETEQFLEFYRRGLRHILELNRQGTPIREVYASIILKRMLTSNPTGYVDLQSPAGMGLSVLVYNYDGDVYSSDEGRMLAEMGDKRFRLGTVSNTWADLFSQSQIVVDAYETMSEGVPGCCDCAFQPWCGSDPTYHYATQRDLVGHKPTSAFCRRNIEVMKHLVRLLNDDPSVEPILRRWAG